MKPKNRKKYAELADVGYPGMEGIRLRYKDGSGQWIKAEDLKSNPEGVVKYLNDWLEDK